MAQKAADKSTRIVKKIPATDCGTGVTCTTKSGKQYRISQNIERRKFTLWAVVDGGYEKIVTSDSPIELYAMIDWTN